MFSRIHLPRFTGEVRVGIRGDGQHAGLRQDAAAPAVGGEIDAAEFVALDAGDAVDVGQAFVDEGVVGIEEIQEAAIFAHDVGEERARVSRASSRRSVVVEVREQPRGRVT